MPPEWADWCSAATGGQDRWGAIATCPRGRDTDLPSGDFKISTPQRLDFLLQILLHLPVGLPLDVIVPSPDVLVSTQHRVLEVLKRLLMGLCSKSAVFSRASRSRAIPSSFSRSATSFFETVHMLRRRADAAEDPNMEFVILGQCWKDQHTEKVECLLSHFRLDASVPRDAIRAP